MTGSSSCSVFGKTKRREAAARLKLAAARHNLLNVKSRSEQQRLLLHQRIRQLRQVFAWRCREQRRLLDHLQDRLGHLNPAAVLARGYAIATTWPEGKILRDSQQTEAGADITLQLHKGILSCKVNSIS